MASASFDASGHMESHIVSASNPLSPVFLQQLADADTLDEISNYLRAMRHRIYWHGNRNKADNTLRYGNAVFYLPNHTPRAAE